MWWLVWDYLGIFVWLVFGSQKEKVGLKALQESEQIRGEEEGPSLMALALARGEKKMTRWVAVRVSRVFA